jgi:hypothetical protein
MKKERIPWKMEKGRMPWKEAGMLIVSIMAVLIYYRFFQRYEFLKLLVYIFLLFSLRMLLAKIRSK